MDFSKAFDKVSHNLLTHKLNYYGIQGKTNKWIYNFLKSRTQAVVLEGVTSDYVPVQSGVPQGSVLGPSQFLFYINDIPVGLDSTIRLFADDTIAYLTIKSNKDCLTLQKDLDKLGIWENKWKMAFHSDKCNVLSISKIEKVPRGIRGEKSSKDMASSRNLVSTIGALASPKMGDGTRCPEG